MSSGHEQNTGWRHILQSVATVHRRIRSQPTAHLAAFFFFFFKLWNFTDAFGQLNDNTSLFRLYTSQQRANFQLSCKLACWDYRSTRLERVFCGLKAFWKLFSHFVIGIRGKHFHANSGKKGRGGGKLLNLAYCAGGILSLGSTLFPFAAVLISLLITVFVGSAQGGSNQNVLTSEVWKRPCFSPCRLCVSGGREDGGLEGVCKGVVDGGEEG